MSTRIRYVSNGAGALISVRTFTCEDVYYRVRLMPSQRTFYVEDVDKDTIVLERSLAVEEAGDVSQKLKILAKKTLVSLGVTFEPESRNRSVGV